MRQSRPPSLIHQRIARMHLYDHQHSAAYKTSTGNITGANVIGTKWRDTRFLWFGSGTLILRSTHASALSRSMALPGRIFPSTVSYWEKRFFHPHCGTPTDGPYARTIAVCHCVLPSFSSRNWSSIWGADAPAPSAPERQPTGRIWFLCSYIFRWGRSCLLAGFSILKEYWCCDKTQLFLTIFLLLPGRLAGRPSGCCLIKLQRSSFNTVHGASRSKISPSKRSLSCKATVT